jgi:alpha-L-rhamnosidase
LFDTAALYAKWLQDIADAQKESGSVTDVAPAFWPIYSDNVTWPSSLVIIPETLREQVADEEVIRRIYPSARKWIDYMSSFLTNGIISRDAYGDWCVPPEDPKLIHSLDPKRKTGTNLLATAYFYKDLGLMAGYAEMLGESADAARYKKLAESVATAFNVKFLNRELGQYDNGSQTSCVLPLSFGLVPKDQKARVVAQLVHKIEEETHGHIGTGLIGGQYLNRVLTDNGRPDLAYTIATQRDYPGWGYMVGKGATTIWELWNGDTADPAMNSGNHVMLVGDLVIWLYEDLAGIKPDPEKPGFKHIIMKPHPVGDLTFVRATHKSPYGLIVSDWRKTNDSFDWNIEVPAYTKATVYVPSKKAGLITESGRPLVKGRGVHAFKSEEGRTTIELGSGKYQFHSALP